MMEFIYLLHLEFLIICPLVSPFVGFEERPHKDLALAERKLHQLFPKPNNSNIYILCKFFQFF
jgi:hypothetical protein